MTKTTKKQKRGFALMSKAKRKKIARKGGLAYHKVRGLQAVSPAKRKRIARTSQATRRKV